MNIQNNLKVITTTHGVEGFKIASYKGVVTSNIVMGSNIVKDFMAAITDFFGGRSSSYEDVIQKAQIECLNELKRSAIELEANSIVGISQSSMSIGEGMMIVMLIGTAVKIEEIL